MEKAVKRKSNIELLRIIGMLMIISHHYVVNSGILNSFAPNEASYKYIFISLFGMWGKIGINIFILISGYFMCKGNLTIKRYCKVLFEILFYNFIIYFIMLLCGYETTRVKRIFDLFFGLFRYSNGSGNFTSSFIVFYLFIPFLNIFIKKLKKNEYKSFVMLLIFVFTILSTFFLNKLIFGEVFWFIALYFIAGYLRLYPPKWSNSLKTSLKLLIISVLIAIASVLIIIWLFPKLDSLFFVIDSNKLGALMIGVFAFTTFKNLNISYSKFINLVAKTTFGILLIHANSDAFRIFLWQDLLHVNTFASLPTLTLIVRSFIIVSLIFIVCSMIDMIRIYLIETPLFNHFDKIENVIIKVWENIKNIYNKIYNKCFN